MPYDYLISTRKVKGDTFTADPGKVRFLRVPVDASVALPAHAVQGEGDLGSWTSEVVGLADGDLNPNSVSEFGDILVFIHGYNNDAEIILWRQRQLSADLAKEGWRGLVIGFDWPCDDKTLSYIEDRWDAAAVAVQLVEKCVRLLAHGQERNCKTNVHLIGHSTGAYVIMEAFAQAEKDGELYKGNWQIGQVAFIGGDVAASSLSAGDKWSAPMFDRILRLTNYSSPYDSALAVSNAKRLGTAPRAGRVGAPANAGPKVVNVDCGPYFKTVDTEAPVYAGHDFNPTHSWHIGDRVFARDLAMTLEGAIDRWAIPTRTMVDGRLVLIDAPRPRNLKKWKIRESLAERNPIR